MNCSSCKYWEDYTETPINIKVGKCKKVQMFWDSTDWMEDEKGDYVRVIGDKCETIAFVQDGSDYKAELLTMGDFYCNQYENKNPAF